jgi:hypothetical protein
MKRIFLLLLFLPAGAPAFAQYSTQGFFVGGHLNGSSWTLPDIDVEGDNGGGLGVTAGYGFSELFALLLNLDGATISPDEGDDYTLGHVDLAGRFHFGRNRAKGYGQIGLTGVGAMQESDGGDTEVRGGGLDLGGGFMYFFSRPLALDISLHYLIGEVREVKVGNVTIDVEEDLNTARFNIGLTWFP